MIVTIEEFKKFAREELKNSPTPDLDANVFLERILHFSKTEILLNRKTALTCEQLNRLLDAVGKRKTGLPVAYITGYKEFFGFDFIVSPDVLIPKPDTEILVQRGIQIILEKIKSRNFDSENDADKIITVCDMCSGSGCVALSVAKSLLTESKIPARNLPNFTLADISSAALKISMKNADFLEIPQDKVNFVQSNLFEKFSDRTFDVILTNPPYVPRNLVDELLKDGRNEPRLALDGDARAEKNGFSAEDFSQTGTGDGLEIIRSLFPQCKNHLSPDGVVLAETGEYNFSDAQKIARNAGFKTKILKDLEGQNRVIECY